MLRRGRTKFVSEIPTPGGLLARLESESWWVVLPFRSGGVALSHSRPISVEAGGISAPIRDHSMLAVLTGLAVVTMFSLARRFTDG